MRHVLKLKTQLKVVILLFVLNTFAIYCLYAQDCTNCRYADSLGLVALYNATDGPNWKNDSINNWLIPGKNLETWAGLGFTSKRVTSINLSNNNLNGFIPTEICNVANLKTLYLDNNKLIGSIPSGVGNFSKLTTLYIFNNQLSGPIPSGLIINSKFKNFHLYYNQFSFSDISNSNILPNSFSPFYYSPQAKLPAPSISNNGGEITLKVSDINPENNYLWFVNGESIPGFNSSSYSFIPTERTEVYVMITNNIYSNLDVQFQDLILETETIIIESDQQHVNFMVHNPSPVCEPLSVNLTAPEITAESTEGLTFTYFSDAELTNELNSVEASAISISGTYYITCSYNSEIIDTKSVEVVIYPKPTFVGQIDAVTCSGGNNGSINLTVTKGKLPFLFNWSNGATTEDVNTLAENIYTISVVDANKCVAVSDFIVTQKDTISPQVFTQNITAQLNQSGIISISPEQVDNGSYDNCGIASITVFPTSFDCSMVGANTVILTVTDVNGNVSTANATVTIEDHIAPTALAKDITVTLDATGKVAISAAQIDNGSSDVCGIALMEVFPTSFDFNKIGANTVTLSVTDVNGNVSTDVAIVIVEDVIAPTAIAKDITVQLDVTGTVAISPAQIDNGSFDACGIALMKVSPTSFDCGTIGANTVTLTVSDVSGNISTANAIVTITDDPSHKAIAKNISIQLDKNGSASIIASQIDDGSYDVCGIASMEVSQSDFDCDNIGNNQITLIVTDASGNILSDNAIITVFDNVAPESFTKDITVQLDASGTVAISANQINNGSSDACGIASMEVFPTSFDCSKVGANTVTLTLTDVNGNVSTANAIVTVEDKIAPTAIASNITVQLDASGTVAISATQINNGSSDACGIASMEVFPTSFDCSKVGANTVTLTVTDVNGNVSTANAIVTVEDKIAPTAIANNITVQLDASGTVAISATQINNGSSDACGIASMKVFPTSFDCSKVGANTVTLTVTDVNGNVSTANAIVTVEDKIAPIITAPPAITREKGSSSNGSACSTIIDLGVPVVGDNCTINKVSNNAPSVFPTGLTVVTWTVTDLNGNSSTATQNVTITDNGGTSNKIPVINSITSNSPVYIINAATVIGQFTDDNLSTATWKWGDGSSSAGTISGKQVLGSHYYDETGTYDVTLTIKDAYGKTATRVYSYIVVFDIACGDVTGGGWINSEKGDYQLKYICDKANFGFTAKYDNQMNLKGNFNFHLNSVKFDVKSTSLDWLIIKYDHAIFTGKASVNNVSGYEFLVSAVDVDMNKSCSNNNDLLRIIIWNNKGSVVYDNKYNHDIEDKPTDPIGSGSIVIHGVKPSNNNHKSLDLVDNTTDLIKAELFDGLKVYPNPASKVLYVEIPERNEQVVNFDIVDVTGRIITRDVNLELFGQNAWIDLEKYPMKPGFYILRLNELDGTQSSLFRFIKQ